MPLDISLENIKKKIGDNRHGFLRKNKYKVILTKMDSSESNLSLFASGVDIPALDYTTTDLDIGGHIIGVTNKWQPAEVTITFYNTGSEYLAINSYSDKLYNQSNHAFGYYDDVVIDITIIELDQMGNPAQEIKYTKCILRGVGPLQLSYDESTSIETFTATFGVGYREVVKH